MMLLCIGQAGNRDSINALLRWILLSWPGFWNGLGCTVSGFPWGEPSTC